MNTGGFKIMFWAVTAWQRHKHREDAMWVRSRTTTLRPNQNIIRREGGGGLKKRVNTPRTFIAYELYRSRTNARPLFAKYLLSD
jgi:hypothetical protein